MELCCLLSSEVGKSLVETSAPVPIPRPDVVIEGIVAVPTMEQSPALASLLANITASPTRL